MKTIILCVAIVILPLLTKAQSTIKVKPQDTLTNPFEDSLVRRLVGFGISVGNISSNLKPNSKANGTFSASSIFPIRDGLVMTTGKSQSVMASNSSFALSNAIIGSDTFANQSIGRQMLNHIIKANLPVGQSRRTTDVSTIKFDLIPATDSLKFNYVFASEEYNSFVCSIFNDIFGFFIKGEGITGDSIFTGSAFEGYKNIAIIPGTNLPVSINNLNNGISGGGSANSCNFTPQGIEAYIDNSSNTEPLYNYFPFNGLSKKLTAKTKTVPCTPYTLILAIGDVVDNIFDSGVFIESGSMVSGYPCTFLPFSANQMADTITRCQPGNLKFKRCNAQVGDKWVVRFINEGTAMANVDFKRRLPSGQLVNFPDSIVLGIGEFEDSLLVEPIGTRNENKTISLKFLNKSVPYINGLPNYLDGFTRLVLKPVVPLLGNDFSLCWTDSGRFQPRFLNLPKTTYSWKELINGQLENSSLLNCSNCSNPLITQDSSDHTFVLKTQLNNTSCEQIDTVQILERKFVAPVFGITTNEISILNPQTGYTYIWTKNNVTLPNSQTLINLALSDIYSLKVNAPNACELEYSKNHILTGNHELDKSDNFNIYPNPAGLYIIVTGMSLEAQYQIFDLFGRKMETSKPFLQGQISTFGLPNGMYVLRISEKGKIQSKLNRFQILNK